MTWADAAEGDTGSPFSFNGSVKQVLNQQSDYCQCNTELVAPALYHPQMNELSSESFFQSKTSSAP